MRPAAVQPRALATSAKPSSARTSWVVLSAFMSVPSSSSLRVRSVTSSRARRPSTIPAAWARWLTADWVMPSRFAASSYVAPASTRSATSQPPEVRRPRTAAHSHSVVSRARTPGPVAGHPQPPGRGLGPGDRVPGVQVGGAPAGAGALRQRLLDLADADADAPAALAQQPLDHDGQGRGVVEHALELVTGGPLERAEHPDSRPGAARVAGTRSVAAALVEPRWSTVSTAARIAPPPAEHQIRT